VQAPRATSRLRELLSARPGTLRRRTRKARPPVDPLVSSEEEVAPSPAPSRKRARSGSGAAAPKKKRSKPAPAPGPAPTPAGESAQELEDDAPPRAGSPEPEVGAPPSRRGSKGARRAQPCVGCVKSVLANRGDGECYDQSGGGKRCWLCASGHKCTPL
jgi:hypothetical protein